MAGKFLFLKFGSICQVFWRLDRELLLAALADEDTISASCLLLGCLSAYFYREVVDGLLYFFIGFFRLIKVSFWSGLHVFSQFRQDLVLSC